MFGKRVVGTPEAFTGYEDHLDEIGVVCQSQADFIAAMRDEIGPQVPGRAERLRRIYQENYSLEAARCRLQEIIADTGTEAQGRRE